MDNLATEILLHATIIDTQELVLCVRDPAGAVVTDLLHAQDLSTGYGWRCCD